MKTKSLKFILATKLGMTQIYTDRGEMVGVTLLKVVPNVITQIKTKAKDGYEALQLSTGSKKSRNLSKGLKGHFKDLGSFRWSREIKSLLINDKELALGDKIDVATFAVGDVVKASGLTKGKGFQGAVKRHGFAGAPASHGHKHVLRHVGSIGQRFPQHTLKGSRGPGRMGQARVSARGLMVMAVDQATGILALKGAVPGSAGSLIEIRA